MPVPGFPHNFLPHRPCIGEDVLVEKEAADGVVVVVVLVVGLVFLLLLLLLEQKQRE